MSERIKEILGYIMELEPGELRNPELVQNELEELGYSRFEIRQAFRMLDFGSLRLRPRARIDMLKELLIYDRNRRDLLVDAL